MTQLNYTEKEVKRMSFRKLDMLYTAYLKINNLYVEDEKQALESAIYF